MKYKYAIITGLAMNEEKDMKKLSEYAKKGWILDSIVGGFFYKLREDKPQDIIYSLDYQTEVNDEYFDIFKEAGWNKVLTYANRMHIFSAKTGTSPIYSDSETTVDKYSDMKTTTKKGSFYSFIGMAGIIALRSYLNDGNAFPLVYDWIFLFFLTVFIFNFMPYVAYVRRLNKAEKESNGKNK